MTEALKAKLAKANERIAEMKKSGMAMLKTETERTRQVLILRDALIEIINTKPQQGLDPNALVGSKDAVTWNVHMIAKNSLTEDFGPLREGDGGYTGDPQKDWDQFWADIVAPTGEIDVEQVKKELSDFRMLMKFVPEVYMHATGGMCSYVHTLPGTVCSLIDDHISEICQHDE